MSFGTAPVGFANDLIEAVNKARLDLLAGPPPPVLFHYTSLRGVMGITSSRNMRATCIDDLHDCRELQHGVDLIQEEVAALAKSGISSLAKAVLPQLAHYAKREANRTFVLCFCGSPSSEFHWTSYGQYCLRFETDSNCEPLLRSSLSKIYLQYHRVIYEEVKQRAAVRSAIAHIIAALNSNTWGKPQGPWISWDVCFLARIASQLLLDLIVAFKRPEYAPDEEWRLVARPGTALCSSAPDWEDANFDVIVKKDATRYVELHVPRQSQLFSPVLRAPVPFTAVAYSPFVDCAHARATIRRTLDESGYGHIEVTRGEALRYRPR